MAMDAGQFISEMMGISDPYRAERLEIDDDVTVNVYSSYWPQGLRGDIAFRGGMALVLNGDGSLHVSDAFNKPARLLADCLNGMRGHFARAGLTAPDIKGSFIVSGVPGLQFACPTPHGPPVCFEAMSMRFDNEGRIEETFASDQSIRASRLTDLERALTLPAGPNLSSVSVALYRLRGGDAESRFAERFLARTAR